MNRSRGRAAAPVRRGVGLADDDAGGGGAIAAADGALHDGDIDDVVVTGWPAGNLLASLAYAKLGERARELDELKAQF